MQNNANTTFYLLQIDIENAISELVIERIQLEIMSCIITKTRFLSGRRHFKKVRNCASSVRNIDAFEL